MQILLHKRTIYSFAFTLVCLLFSGILFGQNVTIGNGDVIDASTLGTGANITIQAGGTLVMNGPKTFSSITTSGVGTSIINGTGILTVDGNGNNGGAITLGSGNMLVLNVSANATSLQTADLNSTNATIKSDLNSVTLALTSVVVNAANGNPVPTSTLIIGENISVSTTSVDQGNGGNNSAFIVVNGTLKISGSGRAIRTGAKYIKSLDCGPNSTVEYNGPDQTLYSTVYQNLILSGSGTKTLTNVAIINGNFTMSPTGTNATITASAVNNMNFKGNITVNTGATFNAVGTGSTGLAHTVGGNWNNSGTFNAGTSTVTFNGSSLQEISGNNTTTFNNLTVNNSAGALLNKSIEVNGNLTLTNGQLTTTSTNLLTLNNNATASGGSISSFINGPMQKIGFTTSVFTFPVGKNGKYAPAGISAAASVGDVFTAEYLPANDPTSAITARGLMNVGSCENWDLHRVSGSSSVNVTLSWNASTDCNGATFFSDPASIVIAHYNGVSWDAYGVSSVSKTGNTGSVTWNNVPNFSRFTFGQIATMGVLPVHFSNVRASEKASGVQVDFTNLTESDVAYYEVERALDGNAFSAVKRLAPNKNNYGSAAYSYLDATAKEGRLSYRIKAVETTGKIIYSSVVNISLGVAKYTGMTVYAKGGQVALQVGNLPQGRYQVQLFSAAGQLLGAESITHGGGSLSQTTSLKGAKAGLYILNINGTATRLQQKFMVQ